MTFDKLLTLIHENITEYSYILIVEDNTGLQAFMKASLKRQIPLENIKVVDNATDAIIFIGENINKLTHYSLDYDLAYGEKGVQVAEFLKQQGNNGDNVWIHSGNEDNREEFLQFLPNAHVVPSPNNVTAILATI